MSTTTTQELPLVPEAITAEWLGSKLGQKIKSIEETRRIMGTGSKVFYTITYEDGNDADESRPKHVCIKGVFDPEMTRDQPWTVSLAQREADFYTKIAPTVQGYMTYPKSWWSGTSEKQGIVVMTDLVHKGCIFPPEVATYSVDNVKDAVDQLAGLHAQYWGQSEHNHPWIWNNYDAAMRFICKPWNDLAREPGRFPLPEHLMDGDRCYEAVDRYYGERNPRFRTLLHGDTHIGNIFFDPKGKLGFIDWSAYHFGSCFHDLVYHMTALLSVEDRRAHEWEILDYYLEALHRKGGPKFDRNDPDVMIEYRRSFMTSCIWLICPHNLQTKERVYQQCERTVAAFVDHDVVNLILSQPKRSVAA